ncbi:hypothetical protein JW926_16640, partial [Candidatus Sumerlaeota bacterium]|nr:hypothetical protein [Candidatus Sumerlaeota bacterium]
MASHKNGNLWKTEQLNSDPNENYRVHNLLYDPSNDKMNLFVSYYEANEKIWAWPHNGSSWETKKAFCNQYSFYNWGEATLNPLNNYFYDAYFHNTTDRKIYLCKSNLSSADPSPTLVRDITYFYIHPVKTLADSLGYVWVAWEESWGSLRVSRFNPDKTVAGIDQYVLEYSAASPTDIVEDAAGNIWVIYTLGENIKAKYYNGSTWNTVNIVSSGRLNGNAKAWTDSDEYLYVVYQGYDETVRPTLRMTKGKAGESFTAPVQVNSNRNSNYPSISHQFGDTFFKNGVVAWAENYPRKDDPGYGSLVLARKHKAEILINNGDQSTENRTISLSISVADPTNATVYLDGDFEAWEDGSLVKLPLLVDLQTNQPTIVSGTGGIYDNIILTGCCGEKKITAVFEDNNGNISLEYVATIDYTGKPLSQITKAQWNSPEKKIDLYWNLEIPCDSSDIESINLYIDRDNNGSYESNIPLSGTWGVYTFDLASENADIFAFNIAAKHTTTSCGGSQENIYEKDPVVVKTNDILLIPWPQCVDFQIAPNLPHSPGQSHYIYFQYSEPIEDSDDYESFNQLKGDLDLLYPYMEDHYQAANASSGGQSNIILINPELSYLEGEIPIEPFYTAKSLMPANEDVYFIRSLKSLLDWQKEEMYLLYSYDDNGCINYVIAGTTPKARFYGAQTLRQLINQNTNGAIQGSCILDWPFTKIRGLRFNIGSGNREKWFEEVSGVDGKWGLQYTNLVTPTTTPTPYPNEPDAVSRLKYFANLKMNALMIQSCLLYHLIEGSQESGDYENNPLKTYEKFEHYWDYDWATPGWDYIGDKEYGFYPIITLFEKCKKLFIDPVPILCDNECVTLCMLEKPQEPDFNDKFFFRSNCHGSAFSEGVHCYRIPFIFQQGLNIAQPVYPVSVPIPIENAVKNGDFSENQFKDINATSTPVPYWDVNQTNTRLDCSTFLDGVVSCHLSNGSELIQVVNLPDRYKNTYMKLKLSGKIDNTADELKPSVSVIETGYIYPPSPRESSQKWYTSWRDYPYTPPVGIDQENRTDVFYTGTNNSLTIKASAGALTGNLFL